MKRKNQPTIEDVVYAYPTAHSMGFTNTEIEELLKSYPEVKRDKFEDALMGNTCVMNENNEVVHYFCDIATALRCGIQNRKINLREWD